jgi:hypothetical protein
VALLGAPVSLEDERRSIHSCTETMLIYHLMKVSGQQAAGLPTNKKDSFSDSMFARSTLTRRPAHIDRVNYRRLCAFVEWSNDAPSHMLILRHFWYSRAQSELKFCLWIIQARCHRHIEGYSNLIMSNVCLSEAFLNTALGQISPGFRMSTKWAGHVLNASTKMLGAPAHSCVLWEYCISAAG